MNLSIMQTIKIIKNNAGIDAVILTKDKSVEGVQKYFGCSLKHMAAIGDEVIDLPLLTKQGLGFVGAPINAQKKVKDILRNQNNAYISQKEVFNGFLDFYNESIKRGIKLIISDKDGVLKDGDKTFEREFARLAMQMGQEKNPYVFILTGSSYQQNLSFIKKYFFDNNLESNVKIKEYPWLLLAESGAIHINVLTNEIRNYVNEICPDLLSVLKTDFEPKVKTRLEEKVFPKFNLSWSTNYNNQNGKVYHVKDKLSMITFNVPRCFANGAPYRKSPESEKFRSSVAEIMTEVAEELKLPYEII